MLWPKQHRTLTTRPLPSQRWAPHTVSFHLVYSNLTIPLSLSIHVAYYVGFFLCAHLVHFQCPLARLSLETTDPLLKKRNLNGHGWVYHRPMKQPIINIYFSCSQEQPVKRLQMETQTTLGASDLHCCQKGASGASAFGSDLRKPCQRFIWASYCVP